MPAAIVVPQSIGQIGNRLEQFSHLIAFSRETGCQIINPSFSLYSEFFVGTHDDVFCRYPAVHSGRASKTAQRLAYYALRAAAQVHLPTLVPQSIRVDVHWSAGPYDLGNPQFRRFIQENAWVFLMGHWKHRHWSGYDAALPAIREHFQLVPTLRKKVVRHMELVRQSADVVVGFHVRQGDNFTDPVRRDAFTSQEHAAVAHQIAALFPGQRVVFLLCTNKPQPIELYGGLTVHHGPGDFILDMYCLAECDYIAGAGQSSFSGWASLMGAKPRYRLFDPGKAVNLADFVVCKGVED